MSEDREFQIGEMVKLRAKPEITGPITAIHQVNNVPCVAALGGWGERWFEEIQHLDEPEGLNMCRVSFQEVRRGHRSVVIASTPRRPNWTSKLKKLRGKKLAKLEEAVSREYDEGYAPQLATLLPGQDVERLTKGNVTLD